ncbi:MAG: hypothetical protein ACLSGI_04675 [Butyricicoccaceae bacterium]
MRDCGRLMSELCGSAVEQLCAAALPRCDSDAVYCGLAGRLVEG